ncbi:hypothetical protein Tco_0569168 [Tanacetum coccineum]
MSTQQDIYVAGSENRPPMLNKDNYVPWPSRLLRYAKSKPYINLIYNSIMLGPYVRRVILEPGDPDREVPVAKTYHEQTDEELTKKETKQMEADDQAIQTILMGLPEDIYAVVDSCETAQEIWLRVQQMMKDSDIGIQEKKAKLFNEWERFNSTDGESIESYYHRFAKLINDFKIKKHFPEKIASNLKFLNNLQPEWSRHVTIVHQPKDLHKVDYTQLYDFLKYNQNGNGNVVAARAEVGPRRRDAAYLQTQLLIAQKEEAWIQLQAEEFDLMAAAGDLDEIKEVNANYILMANLQQASTSDFSVEQYGGTVEQNPATVEETCAYFESLYNNLAIEVISKVGEMNALSKPVTSNSAPLTRESKVMNSNRVIAPGMFWINPFKTYMEKQSRKHLDILSVSLTAIMVIIYVLLTLRNQQSDSFQIPLLFLAGTVRFGNDHVAAILGYGDLQWGNIFITMVYFVEGLRYNLFSVRQFYDSDLEVAF